ncbi:hypothetical protein [Leisingera daeponensis]|uniref:hypothetical protein n=1 Tax=Leisingera daeponensis TaxID=405746 RepID=UPI0004807118|nr:hypothetical protein [Leisingera daeponensis]
MTRDSWVMAKPGSALSPGIRLRDIFACKAMQTGQVLRRKNRDIERYAGREAFLAGILAGFRLPPLQPRRSALYS